MVADEINGEFKNSGIQEFRKSRKKVAARLLDFLASTTCRWSSGEGIK
jgi:hypothetical protein